MKKKGKTNPVAKFLNRVSKPAVFRDRSKFRRHEKHRKTTRNER